MATTSHIVGRSRHVEALRKAIGRLERNRHHCAIVGEPGVGKTLFATELGSSDAHFLAIQVARMTEEELDGALTACPDGTVVFEDLESSSFRQQARILDFVQRRGNAVRVIVTLASSLEDLHERHKLLDELYAKVLSFESVEILPLRERPEDIPELIRHFAPNLVMDINGLDSLIRRLWHENIRELRTIVERCLSAAPDGVFRLPEELVEEQPEVARVLSGMLNTREQALDTSLDGIERGIIGRALERCGFDFSSAAKFLGMKSEDLEQKARRLGLVAARNT